jgi:hypothetical protein
MIEQLINERGNEIRVLQKKPFEQFRAHDHLQQPEIK